MVGPVLKALMNRDTKVKMNYLNLWQLDLENKRYVFCRMLINASALHPLCIRLASRKLNAADSTGSVAWQIMVNTSTVMVLAHISSLLINEFTCRLYLYHQKALRIWFFSSCALLVGEK
jgi:hypothetical protein